MSSCGTDRSRPSERQRRTGLRIVLVDRLVGVPCGLRKLLQQIVDLSQQRRRGHTSGEQAKAFAVALLHPLQLRLQRLPERFGRGDLTVFENGSRAVGIVQRQHRGLGEYVGRAEARRMPRIAFDLDRASVDRGDDDTAAESGKRQRGREFQRFAGDNAFGHFHVGNDFFRRFAAGGEPARDSRGEQAQRLAAVQRGRAAGEELRSLDGQLVHR